MASRPELMLLVDECVRRLKAGESLEACLADYPAEADALRPLVEVALWVGTLPDPPPIDPSRRAAARSRFLARAAAPSMALRAEPRKDRLIQSPAHLLALADVIIDRVRAGASLEACLAQYPAEANELRPLVETALLVRSLPAPPPPDAERRAAGRAAFLARAAELNSEAAEQTADMVDAVVASVAAGLSLGQALAAYPQQAERLRPLAEAALAVRALPAPPPVPAARMAAYRATFLAAAAAMNARARAMSTPARRRVGLGLAAFLRGSSGLQRLGLAVSAAALVLAVTTTGVVTAAAAALPGDALYSVKEATRAVQLALALDPVVREEVAKAQQAQKQEEIVELAERRRSGLAEAREGAPLVRIPTFTDVVTAVGEGGIVWVGKIPVRLTGGSLPGIGSLVQVMGVLGRDGVVDVTQLQVLALPTPESRLAGRPASAPTEAAVAIAPVAGETPTPSASPNLPPASVAAGGAANTPRATRTPTATAAASVPPPAAPALGQGITRATAAPDGGATPPTEGQVNPANLLPAPTAPPLPTSAPPTDVPSGRPGAPRDNVEYRSGTFLVADATASDETWLIETGAKPNIVKVVISESTRRSGPSQPVPGDNVVARGRVNGDRLVALDVKVTRLTNDGQGPENSGQLPASGKVVSRSLAQTDNRAVWVIRTASGDLTLVETDATHVEGVPSSGMVANLTANVIYHLQNGVAVADSIIVVPARPQTYGGLILAVSDTELNVGRVRVILRPDARREGPAPRVGDTAQLEGYWLPDGAFDAIFIKVEPFVRRTPVPTVETPSPTPTATLTTAPPVNTPTPTVTAVPPTETPVVGPSPTATAPEVTATPAAATPTAPAPTAPAPTATDTPPPTGAPPPTDTPHPPAPTSPPATPAPTRTR